MNCWKSFNITKDLGSLKLTIFSILGLISFYIVFNLSFHREASHNDLSLLNVITFIVLLMLILPIHKLLHGAPIWLAGKKADLVIERNRWFPIVYCQIKGPISKYLAIISLGCPAIVVTFIMILLALIFPSQMNEYAFIGAINFGLSVFDILYLLHLFSAPTHAFIEDDRDCCRILIKESVKNKAI
ncbi:asparagine N-glycosylation enzyme membrane subunit Stt3 [Pullulanibacillus pueri]|uniref:Putative membrane protein YhaJ n=1 Tax=Pullulanibacillus pueri TaxID=1437324 RepID=A0A8J3ENI5_9BACL|nr:DUF3267 domain-containing protein [Pullulanibacillus pueri]MBM7683428.1 asparagine N-glycosylation enzyme membrane subunit Stt3 [Pullulanibacillus pueri]GGH88096.1 putative membrane protein YhaJ [Pullulanibacillus pueri]